MLHATARVVLVVISSALYLALIQTPSNASAAASKLGIDCRKARSVVEREICGNTKFRALDRDIAATYDKDLKAIPASEVSVLRDDQIKWLVRRDACIDKIHGEPPVMMDVIFCLRKRLEQRLTVLDASLKAGKAPDDDPFQSDDD
jgi:uncharacterized protein YecT (DUF1311 family)